MTFTGIQLLGFEELLDTLEQWRLQYANDQPVWNIGTDVEYSVYQEFGTVDIVAKWYLRNATTTVAQRLDGIVTPDLDLEEIIERIARMIERRAIINAPVDTGNLQSSIAAERMQ